MSHTIEIKALKSPKEINQFINFPYTLYKNNPYWVPPIKLAEKKRFNPKKNPCFKNCDVKFFAAFKEGKMVGRVLGIHHHLANKTWQQKQCRFGWMDFIDDLEVSKALFNAIEGWAYHKGLESIHGPLGFTDLDPQGVLVEGFTHRSTSVTTYNFDYYPRHFEAHGLTTETHWSEHNISFPEKFPQRFEKLAPRILEKEKLTLIHSRKKKDILPYIPNIFELVNISYKNLFGYVPINAEERHFYFEEFKDIIQPEYIPIILNKNGQVVAFGFGFPNLSKTLQKIKGRLFPFNIFHVLSGIKHHKEIELGLIAVHPNYQKAAGIPIVLFYKGYQAAKENGIENVYCNPVLESNTAMQDIWKYAEHEVYKRRACFSKKLNF